MVSVKGQFKLLDLLEQNTKCNENLVDVLAFFEEETHVVSLEVYYGEGNYAVYTFDGLDYGKAVKDCYESNRKTQYFEETMDQEIFENIERVYQKLMEGRKKI